MPLFLVTYFDQSFANFAKNNFRIFDKNAIGFTFKDRGGLPIGFIRVFCLVFLLILLNFRLLN